MNIIKTGRYTIYQSENTELQQTQSEEKRKQKFRVKVKTLNFYVNLASVIIITIATIFLVKSTCNQTRYMKIESEKSNVINISNIKDTLILQIIEQDSQKLKTKKYKLR